MNEITLGGLLSVIQSTKTIKINLYDSATELLIISFDLPGYAALEDEIEQSPVNKIEIANLTTLNISITRG